MAVHDTGGGGGRGGGSPALNSGLQGKFQRKSWALSLLLSWTGQEVGSSH